MSCKDHSGSCGCSSDEEISYEFAPIEKEGLSSIHVYALPESSITKPWNKESSKSLIDEVHPLSQNEDSSDVVIGTFVDGKYQPHVVVCASPDSVKHKGVRVLAEEIKDIISKDLPKFAALINKDLDESKKTLNDDIPFTFMFSFSSDPEDFSPLIYSFAICDIWQDAEEEGLEEWNPETPFQLIALPFCAVKKLSEGENPEAKRDILYIKQEETQTFDVDQFYVGSPAYADVLRYASAVVSIPVCLPEDKMPVSENFSHPTLLVALMDKDAALTHCLNINIAIDESIEE